MEKEKIERDHGGIMKAEGVDILLVEDNPNDVRLTLKALSRNNLNVNLQRVADGEEAIDFIFCRNDYAERNRNEMPRLILLDLKLPRLNGLEVLKILKEDERTKAIPVVILTSSNQESDIAESYELGVNSYIVKPVDFDQFNKCIAELGLYWLLLNQYPN